jgi:hypothetical protein
MSDLHRDKKATYTKEEYRRHENALDQKEGPTYHQGRVAALAPRAPALVSPPFSLCLLGWFPTAIEFQSQSLIQVGLIQWLTFI